MNGSTIIAGIEVPSVDPLFLAIVFAVHIPLGLLCVISGAVAMLLPKGRGRHSDAGTIYFWGQLALFSSATILAIMRWAENYHLFALGLLSFAAAWFGRAMLQRHWPDSVRLHVAGMGSSYVLMLVAFYVDNGKQLPVWRELPHFMYWLLPLAIGLPIILHAMFRHPLAQRWGH
ncbi:hypothetical protein EDE08_109331 [Bradyrhizobium sp. R2.2-H]|jgi:hypothetical protein|uniref:DUF2306 domain-containing protein n=1 Tax=unclassified Bradyrhizobium TaxID=2631580 RepID=UPI0010467A59|nr:MULTISPECIES: DUF2306 domain-containing protein [unclassified Bradyrhizobium]TCU68270.1 hypothetical protein EDE10_10982 [Bradyrhizobium sp. Y-H1]TCU70108.1 hypothetical protein EDE08_109331 [Bradyrhizobium sp. R2.2-H]